MLFFGGKTNSLIKGSSIDMVLEDRVKDVGNGNGAGDEAGEHADKHVGEDRNEDSVKVLVRTSVRILVRIRCGGILVELLC